MAENKPDTRPDCVVTGWLNGRFISVLLRGEKSKGHALGYGQRKGWRDVRVIQTLAFAIGAAIGVAADRAQAAPMDDVKQYAMVLTATELMENVNCGTAQQAVTFDRLADNGIEVRGRDAGLFLQTVEAISIIYRQDPEGFCRRARRNAGRN